MVLKSDRDDSDIFGFPPEYADRIREVYPYAMEQKSDLQTPFAGLWTLFKILTVPTQSAAERKMVNR